MDPLIKRSQTDPISEIGDTECVSPTGSEKNLKKRRPAIHEILSTLLFLSIIYVFAVIMLFMPDKDYSEEENRSLEQFPALSSEISGNILDRISKGKFLDRLLSGEFNSDMVSYFSDQFPFRNTFIGIKALSECIMFGGENNGFFASDDGYIIERSDFVDHAVLDEYSTVIENFSREMADRDIPVTVSVVGRVFDIMTDMLPEIYQKEKVSEKEWVELEKRLGADDDAEMPFS